MNLAELETKNIKVSPAEKLDYLRRILKENCGSKWYVIKALLRASAISQQLKFSEVVEWAQIGFSTARNILPDFARHGLIQAKKINDAFERIAYDGAGLAELILECIKELSPRDRSSTALFFGLYPDAKWGVEPADAKEIAWFRLYNMDLVGRMNADRGMITANVAAAPLCVFAAIYEGGFSHGKSCLRKDIYKFLRVQGQSAVVRHDVEKSIAALVAWGMVCQVDAKRFCLPMNVRLAIPFTVRTLGRHEKKAMLKLFPWIPKILPID